ncbi:MAG: arginine--tRNA ligase [Candidatus Aminicenantes bacterium RBG_13_63_10]|nr:MAG: arginine--tRNA ligase [Candidatus Aminicenantes bacterium RBG_13_63_10]
MLLVKEKLKSEICSRLKDSYPVEPADIDLTPTPHARFGDLALTLPFQLAKKMKVPPRDLAGDMLSRLADLEGVNRAEVAGPGYINFFLDRGLFIASLLAAGGAPAFKPEERKIVVEHTNINPNKAAHIGHLRNACLGDTLVRCLRSLGESVEVQNYIDDTGVQVVDVVFGFLEMEKKTPAEVKTLPGKFDYLCWDLYARVSAYLAAHPEAQPRKAEIVKRVEHGQGPEAELARHISHSILRAHLATMARLGVTYDVLPCESSILGRRFWEKAFGLLRGRGAVSLAAEGLNSGCWVMRLEDDPEREKIIVRSDGTVTYVGKDIAYQMWKFGLLGEDFGYEPFHEEDGRTIWISTSEAGNPSAPSFGGASKVYNVIDTRQAYLQKIVVQGLKALGHAEEAEKSIHFSYEMVALSPKSLKELDYTPTEDDADKAFLEVSGRKGLGVKADDLLDRLEEKALTEIEKRNPDLSAEAKTGTARRIASGALRYFMLKFSRNSLIVFDFEEALSFEGETGPYLQYSLVRLNSIFRKLEEREGRPAADVLDGVKRNVPPLSSLSPGEMDDFWELAVLAGQLEEETRRSVKTLEFSHLAKFAFILGQKSNSFYHKYPVLAEEDERLKSLRLLILDIVRKTLRTALTLMGIPLPERM